MSVYRQLKRTFRGVVPKSLQEAIWSTRNPLRGTLIAIKGVLERSAPHDDVYDREYYERDAVGQDVESAHIAESIIRDLSPRTVLDVGCGFGILMSALDARGVQTRGLELSRAAIDYCRSAGLDVEQFDLEEVSLEVAEHLPASASDNLIRSLTDSAPNVVFTAASPGQGGVDHVNEQPPQYWTTKFQLRGFELNQSLTDSWRDEWERLGVGYGKNLMVFSRSTA
jgi:SAM-dependent methyltransferase